MNRKRLTVARLIRAGAAALMLLGCTSMPALAQSSTNAPILAPETLKQPLSKDWTSYSGDYTGQRFSHLTQVTPANVKTLGLAWSARIDPSIPRY